MTDLKPRKPTRRDLLVVIGRLQNMIGEALGQVEPGPNDDVESVRKPLERAHSLCIDSRSYDPPLEQKGPWA